MKITNVKIRWVEGRMVPGEGDVFYDSARASRVRYLPVRNNYQVGQLSDGVGATLSAGEKGVRKLREAFVYIETDEGITGVAGPLIYAPETARTILREYAPCLLGEDPMNNERLWDIMYRKSPVSYAGKSVIALSYCDVAVWDIRCKRAGLPLYQMVGGRTQRELPVYANCTGCAFNDADDGYDLDLVAERTKWCVEQGFTGAKWYPHRGPADGEKGIRELVDMFRVIREAGGPDFKIMIDVWSAWEPDYALAAAKKLAPLDIFWLEEPVMANQPEAYAEVAKKSPIPISCGENMFMRWQFQLFLRQTDVHWYQPDPVWCGGITETLKILTLIEASGKKAALHNSSVPLGAHLATACPASFAPINEYLLTISPTRQFFFAQPCHPRGGLLVPGEAPGVGLDIDESKVEASSFDTI